MERSGNLQMLTRVLGVALGTALLLAPAASPEPDLEPPVPAAAGSSVPVKYYVVGPAVNGQPEYLFAIAAATLGDGNRMREIFELNEGRQQPYGRLVTDPTRIEPGWVLVLPSDASGPGVQVGALPLAGPSTPAVVQPPTSDQRARSGSPALQLTSMALLVSVVALVTAAALLWWRRRTG